jgi:hypothetical protein
MNDTKIKVKKSKHMMSGGALFINITFRPAQPNYEEINVASRELYKIREKVSLPRFPSPPPKQPKIRWREFLGGPYIFYLKDGSTIIGRLVQQRQSFIKLVDVTILRNGIRTRTRWMMQDGAEVKSFIPADAVTEKIE